MSENLICVICKHEISHPDCQPGEYLGNNPFPIFDEGRCCDFCDDMFVTPCRVGTMMATKVRARLSIRQSKLDMIEKHRQKLADMLSFSDKLREDET